MTDVAFLLTTSEVKFYASAQGQIGLFGFILFDARGDGFSEILGSGAVTTHEIQADFKTFGAFMLLWTTGVLANTEIEHATNILRKFIASAVLSLFLDELYDDDAATLTIGSV